MIKDQTLNIVQRFCGANMVGDDKYIEQKTGLIDKFLIMLCVGAHLLNTSLIGKSIGSYWR